MSAPGALIILFNISVKLVAFTVVMRYPRPISKNSQGYCRRLEIHRRCNYPRFGRLQWNNLQRNKH